MVFKKLRGSRRSIKKLLRNKGCTVIPCPIWTTDDLKDVCNENHNKYVASAKDGLGERKHGSDYPRFNSLIMIETSRENVKDVILRWKALLTPVSYFTAHPDSGNVSIGYYASNWKDAATQASVFVNYLEKKEAQLFYPVGIENARLLYALQVMFDSQIVYAKNDSLSFPYSLAIEDEIHFICPISSELTFEGWKPFHFE